MWVSRDELLRTNGCFWPKLVVHYLFGDRIPGAVPERLIPTHCGHSLNSLSLRIALA